MKNITNEQLLAQYRKAGTPQPNVEVLCVWCQTPTLKVGGIGNPRHLKGGHTYYWRRYVCKTCEGSTWVGVHRETNDTVYSSISPHHTAFNTVAVLHSHEDVVKGWFYWTPKQTRGVHFADLKTKEAIFHQRRSMYEWWKHVNNLALSWRSEEDLAKLYAKLFVSYHADLPDATSQVATPKPQELEENERY